MAIVATSLGVVTDNTDSNSYTTGTISPAANSAVFIAPIPSIAGTPIPPTLGGTLQAVWTPIISSAWDTSGNERTMYSYVFQFGATPGSGTISFTYLTTQIGHVAPIVQITGHNTAVPVRTINGGIGGPKATHGTGATQSATLDALSSTSNACLAFVASDEIITFTASNGFTLLAQGGITTPITTAASIFKINATNPGTTNGGSGVQNWGMVAFEIQAAATLVAGFPTLAVYLGLGSDWNDPSPTWTQVPTGLVKTVDVATSGRQFDLDQFVGGGGTITFKNNDGRFSPTNTSSPYWPNLHFGTPIKCEATQSGTTYTFWRGFLEECPVMFADDVNNSLAPWTVIDAFGMFEGKKAEYPWYSHVRAAGPTTWLRFEEQSGVVAIDSSGNGNHGTYQNSPTLGVSSIISLGATFDGSTEYLSLPLTAAISGTGDFAIEFLGTVTTSTADQILWFQQDASGNRISIGLKGSTPGPAVAFMLLQDSGGGTTVTGTTVISGDKEIIWRRQGTTHEIWVNGVLDGTTTDTARNIPAVAPTVMATAGGTNPLNATVDELVVYAGVTLTSAQTLDHYAALNAYHLASSGQQINYMLDSVNWPTDNRIVDTGQELVLGQFEPSGSLLDMMRLTNDSEFGAFYVRPDGDIRFRERHAILKYPYTASQGSFGNGSGLLPVSIRSLKMEYARSRIKNDVTITVSWKTSVGSNAYDVQVHKIDQASSDTYGPQDWSRNVLTGSIGGSEVTALKLADLVDWVLAHYKDPIREIRQLELRPHSESTGTYWAHVLGRVQEDRITHSHTAPWGEVISGDYHIQRIAHSIGEAKTWTTIWTISPADTQIYGLYDSGVYDTARYAA